MGLREALVERELSGELAVGVVLKEAREGVKLAEVEGTLLMEGPPEVAGEALPTPLLLEPEPLSEGLALTLGQPLEEPPTNPPATAMPRVDCVSEGSVVKEEVSCAEADGHEGVL